MRTSQHLADGILRLRHLSGRGMVPIAPSEDRDPEQLRINIVHTDVDATELALKRAVELAIELEASTQVIVPYVVPYPLALERPDVPLEIICTKLRLLAGSSGADPYIHVYLCRDVNRLLIRVLPAGSIVVLGTKKRWLLPTKEEKIARTLERSGCDVILAHP